MSKKTYIRQETRKRGRNIYLQIHVPLGEVASREVEVGAVDGHQLGQEHPGGLRLHLVEVVAVHEDAALGGVAVDVDVQVETGGLGIPGRGLDSHSWWATDRVRVGP